jgi:hypothetical protein
MQPFYALRGFRLYIALCGLLAAITGGFGGASAYAELMQTSPGVFQSTDSKVKVIASSGGIFIVSLKTGIPIQQFNIEKLPSEEASHAFVRFAPDKGRNPYSEIVIANSRYPITGNLTLRVGEVSVSVDNSNPYATVKYNDGSPEGTEQFALGLSSPVNASLLSSLGAATISDDDKAGAFLPLIWR